jgi:hypothetical protein
MREKKSGLLQIAVLCADADANAGPDRIWAAKSMTSPLIRTGRILGLFVLC